MYGIPVRQLQAMLTSRDFAELLAYERIEGPVGPWREDFRFAALRFELHQLARALGRVKGKAPRIEDFMPGWWRTAEARRYPGRAAVMAKLEGWVTTHRAATGTG